MIRRSGLSVSPELFVLFAAELVLSSLLIYAVLASSARSDGGSLLLAGAGSASLAASVAFATGILSLAISVLQADTPGGERQYLRHVVGTALIAFAAALALARLFWGGASSAYVLWSGKVFLVWAGCVLASRGIFAVAARRKLFVRRIVVLGEGARAERLQAIILRQRGRLFALAGRVGPAESDALAKLPGDGRIWAIVTTAGAAAPPALAGVGGRPRVIGDVVFWERHLGRIDLANAVRSWAEGQARGRFPGAAAAAIRRAIDLAGAGLLLAFLLPTLLVVAALIRLDSPGPVMFRQERVGLRGRAFTLWKFRSMQVNAEAEGTPRWAVRNDPRITRLGALLRSTRIDELPQLLNVLRGEMSLVGPRPERPHFVGVLARDIPFYRDRLLVKPGITGWAQVNLPYSASVEDARRKLSYDLYYVKNRSILLDLLILLSTIRVILCRMGAR